MGVDATVADGVLIASFLDQQGKLRELLEQLEKRHYAQANETLDDWQDKAVRCLFQNEIGRCEVYSCRPVTCRAYFVISDTTSCSGSSYTKIKQVDPTITQIRASCVDSVLWTCLGMPNTPTTLPGAVWAVGKNLLYRETFSSFQKRVQRDWPTYTVQRRQIITKEAQEATPVLAVREGC